MRFARQVADRSLAEIGEFPKVMHPLRKIGTVNGWLASAGNAVGAKREPPRLLHRARDSSRCVAHVRLGRCGILKLDMPVIISMLRAVNVAGHNLIKMDALRELYQSLKLRDAQTYVQSGNVVFRTEERDLALLTTRIQNGD